MDGTSAFAHYEHGSIYYHPDTGAREIYELVVRYKDETETLTRDQMRVVVGSLSLGSARLKKPGTWEDILKSDPLGQDPGEPPNFAGKEGWYILEKTAERLQKRYEQRFENQPPGPELEVDRPGRSERGTSFRDMDRGNYEAERFDRDKGVA
jgi:hypothetical protein